PAEWRQAFHDRKAHSVREILCVLYVAMTRARSALFMITAPRVARSQNGSQQCQSLLQSVLGQADQFKTPEAVLYERGDPKWFLPDGEPASAEHARPGDAKQQPAQAAAVQPAEIALDVEPSRAPRRSLRVAAPSSIAALRSVELSQLFTRNEMLGASVGTLVHACFEQVQWLDDFRYDAAALRRAVIAALTPEEIRHLALDKELENFERMLHLSAVKQALSRQRYAGLHHGVEPDQILVENERRISLILDNQLIDGSIDRLVVLMHQGRPLAAEILDYKTDRWDSRIDLEQWIDQRVEHHRPQLKAYAEVVSRMLKLPMERIDCALVLLSGDACVRCDDRAPKASHLKPKQLHLAW
ncbi:MAG: PD-(D/E)XK nuclease family protein, partial [Aureliella sp.]